MGCNSSAISASSMDTSDLRVVSSAGTVDGTVDGPVSVPPVEMTREAKLFTGIGGHSQVLRMTTIFYEVRRLGVTKRGMRV